MNTPNQKKCVGCSKNGKRNGCYNCGSFSDFFHKATPEEKEKVILEVVKEANEEQKKNYERNYSHTHRKIPLTQGKVAIVDVEDFLAISVHKWRAQKSGKSFYAVREVQTLNGSKSEFMHRVILKVTNPNDIVDHIDGNGLNNKRNNLRITNKSGNGHNREDYPSLGTRYDPRIKRFTAQITINGKQRWLGSFKTQKEAHALYLEAKKKFIIYV